MVRFIHDRLPVTIASIILLDEKGTHFAKEVWTGSIDLEQPGQEGVWPITVGLAGRCVRTGEPQLVLDVAADPDYVPGNSTVESEYMVPIRYRDRILGVLNLESTQRDIFTESALEVFDRIAGQIAGAIHLASLNRQLEEANRELERLSSFDSLTGVANRRRFDERLSEEWRRAIRHEHPLTVILADADCFKLLNDAGGHRYGDECLRLLAEVLTENLARSTDLVARYGGEEFGIILPDTTLESALDLAEHLRARVEAREMRHPASTVSPFVTVSFGVATARPAPGDPAERLVRDADVALYRAKEAGRNRVEGSS